jgi:hypothetical protein
MGNLGSFGEGLWASGPAPDDAEALAGAFVQSPLVAAIALLLIAVALMLARAGVAPSLSELAPASPLAVSRSSQLLLTQSQSTVSKGTELRAQGAFAKLPHASIQDKGQTGKHLRDNRKNAGLNLFGKRGQPLDLRLLRTKSNASLERGPPTPKEVNYLAGSDRNNWHGRLRTDQELGRRGWPVRGGRGR